MDGSVTHMNGLHWIDYVLLALVFAAAALVLAGGLMRRRKTKSSGTHCGGCSGHCGSCSSICDSVQNPAGKQE